MKISIQFCLSFLILALPTLARAEIAPSPRIFDCVKDTADLTARSLNDLQTLARKWTNRPETHLQIDGLILPSPNLRADLAFGEKRATVVRDILIKQGIPSFRLITQSYGLAPGKPVQSAMTEQCAMVTELIN